MSDQDIKKGYSPSEEFIIKATPVLQVLEDLGFDVSIREGDNFLSPFRQETAPSFHVNEATGKWYDHGCGVGGDVITLVQMLEREGRIILPPLPDTLERSANPANEVFRRTLIFLNRQYHPEITPIGEKEGSRVQSTERARTTRQTAERLRAQREEASQKEKESRFESVTARDLTSPSLMRYGEQVRHIPQTLLRRYCKQVHYTLKPRPPYTRGIEKYAVGFPNAKGGWVLRNEFPNRRGETVKIKECTSSFPSFISSDGSFIPEGRQRATSGRAVVFEGFFDFLSWMAWTNRIAPRDTDVVVLNSVHNLPHAEPFLISHRQVIGYFDNDDTGRSHSALLERSCREAGVDYRDCAYAYKESNDLAEAWAKEHSKRLAAARAPKAEEARPQQQEEHQEERQEQSGRPKIK